MNFLLKILISTIAVMITAYLLNGVTIGENQFYAGENEKLNHFATAFFVAVVLAFLNSIVKPALTLFSLPITIFTFGFFLLAINAFIILFADRLVDGFKVDGFWTALWFSIVLSIVTWVLELFNNKENKIIIERRN